MSAEILGRNLARVLELEEHDIAGELASRFHDDADAIERGLDSWRAERANIGRAWGGRLDCATVIEDLLAQSGALTLTQIGHELHRRGLAYTPTAIRSTVDTLIDAGRINVRTGSGRRLLTTQHAAPQLALNQGALT